MGQFGVQLFFVVSAITLALSWQHRKDESSPVKSFFIRRYFRIAPMYYVGIFLYIGIALVQATRSGTPIDPSLPQRILANVLFIHGFIPSANNNVVPGGWSIGCEIAFYVLFPIVFSRHINIKHLIGFVISWMILSPLGLILLKGKSAYVENNSFLYFNLITQLPVFMSGLMTFKLLSTNTILPRMKALAAFLFTCSVLYVSFVNVKIFPFGAYFLPLIAAISFCFLVVYMYNGDSFPAFLIEIGRRSFSMYVLHFIFAWMFFPRLNARFEIPSTAWMALICLFASFVGTTLLCFCLAGITYKYIEKPFIRLANKLCASTR